MGQVPALTCKDAEGKTHTFTQSLAIIDFLDAVHQKSPNLIPLPSTSEGARVRTRAIEFAEVVNSGTQPLQNLIVLKSVKSATAHDGSEIDGRGFGTMCIRK